MAGEKKRELSKLKPDISINEHNMAIPAKNLIPIEKNEGPLRQDNNIQIQILANDFEHFKKIILKNFFH